VGRNTPLRVSVDGDVQQVGEVAEWAPSRPVAGPSRCKVSGAGVLRRLGRGKTPFRPSLERATVANSPVGYWRLDDPEGALEAASGLPDGTALTVDEYWRPGQVDGNVPLGTGKGPEFMAGDGQTVSGQAHSAALPSTDTGTYAVDLTIRFQGGLGELFGFDFGGWTATGTAGTCALKIFGVPGIGFQVFIRLRIGTDDEDVGVLIEDSEWHHVRFVITQNGSNIDMEAFLDGVSQDTDTHSSTGTVGRIFDVNLGGINVSGLNTLTSLSVRHLTVWTDTPPDIAAAAVGYLGETAADRVERLCTEESIPVTIVGTAADSHPMGSQPTDTLTELLLECARTDAGMLYEDRDSLGFVYRCGRDLVNQTAVLTLDVSAGGIAPDIEPIVGDLFVRNDVEAKSVTGKARAVLESGAMSVLDPPNGVGRYDTTLDVNPADDGTLSAHAGWHLNRGTVSEIRFRQVTVDLDAEPSLATDVSAVDIGDLVVLTGLDADDSPEDLRALVIRIDQKIGSHRRLVTFTLVPASPYTVGTIGASDGSVDVQGARIDTERSTLGSSVTAYATTLSVASTGILWTTTAAHFDTALHGGGLFITVGGETMRVSNITGASSPQTFTVVRSVNGVVKAHSSGAQVRVRYPARIGL
jgi:hypothetical protein